MELGVAVVGEASPHRPAIWFSADSSIATLYREELSKGKALGSVQLGRLLERQAAERTRPADVNKCSVFMKLFI